MKTWQVVLLVFLVLSILTLSILLPILFVKKSTDLELSKELDLTFKRPVFLTHDPNNPDSLFVVEEEGVIYEVRNKAEKNVFRDFSDFVNSQSLEQGLLGLAFEPLSSRFYIYFTDKDNNIKLRRYDGDKLEDLITLQAPNKFHHGGWIGFGTDGFLYVAVGDTGPQGDPLKNAQDLTKLQGKILRIDVSVDMGYKIPPGNPFVQSTETNIKKEIWSFGLRNPWRCSIDSSTNYLYIGNVGWASMEEIDVAVEGGQNFGWPCMEGSTTVITCSPPPFITPPLHTYTHTSGGDFAVVGGYVYRGTEDRFKDLYFFGDFGSGRIWSLNISNPQDVRERFRFDSVSSFGEGADNTLYALDYKKGRIFQITNLMP